MTPANPRQPSTECGLRSYSGRHRARNHHLAHAEGALEPEAAIPANPLIPRHDPVLIATAPALRDLIGRIRQAKRFGYDSEFIGERSYRPRLCVLQVATCQEVALVDPMAGLDLTEFWQLISDPSIEKIVHAGLQDLEPVHRHLGQVPQNVFDVQVAAGFLGLPYPAALSRLVQEFVGVDLPKGLKFSQWDQRPLSPIQLRYAANDVRYLLALRESMGQRLESLGNAAWAAEECAAVSDPKLYAFDAWQQCLRLRGAGSLSARQRAILRELFVWRDAAAQADDLPPRTLLKDGLLLELARHPISGVDELARLKGLPRPVERQHGPAIVAAIQRAQALPISQAPPGSGLAAPTWPQCEAIDQLWATVQERCHQRHVDPTLAASKRQVSRYYLRAARGKSNAESSLLAGWRGELLGETLKLAVQEERGSDQHEPLPTTLLTCLSPAPSAAPPPR